MSEAVQKSLAYRLIDSLGIHLSPQYSSLTLWEATSRAVRFTFNEILHSIARNSSILAPLNSRFLRPRLHRWRGVKVGKNVLIGINVIFDSVYPEMITIEDGVIITNGVQLLAHQRTFQDYRKGTWIGDYGYEVKSVVIKRGAFIGIGSIILPGVTIGEGAVVSAGSVVTKDVLPYVYVAGVPARVIREVPDGEPAPNPEAYSR